MPRTSAVATRLLSSAAKGTRRPHRIRVCVLNSSYEGSNSPTAQVDTWPSSPAYWVKREKRNLQFTEQFIMKATAYAQVRELVASRKFDVFYNLCDGAKDEARAGVEVINALEDLQVPFTGADSRCFEPNKIDMKMLLAGSEARTPNFVLVTTTAESTIRRQCKLLTFPVIVKHQSGYASVGITKASKCANMTELVAQCRVAVGQFQHALVEEFIVGREGTIFVCGDPRASDGIKVFPPLMLSIPGGEEGFNYFDAKWAESTWTTTEKPVFLDAKDPALPAVRDMARAAFVAVLNRTGYGRCDFRLCSRSGAPYFLEVNPNCGMLYPPESGGCFADMMVVQDSEWDHDRFIRTQIDLALMQQRARVPWYTTAYKGEGVFATTATETVEKGRRLFPDALRPVPVTVKALFKHGDSGASVSCVLARADGLRGLVPVRHSCDPVLAVEHSTTQSICTTRRVMSGRELTIDFASLRDTDMPSFVCACGSRNCRGTIVAQESQLRQPTRRRGPKAEPQTPPGLWKPLRVDAVAGAAAAASAASSGAAASTSAPEKSTSA